MAKEPKEVLKEDGVASVSKVEERRLSMPIHEGHEHGSSQDWSYDRKETKCKEQGYCDEGD